LRPSSAIISSLRNPLLADGHNIGDGTRTYDFVGKVGNKLCSLHGASEPISLNLLESIEQLLYAPRSTTRSALRVSERECADLLP
jgi:hypothetical protein